MSRCFQFPPPGYVRNGIHDEALVESIKKEAENAKKERKREKRREKKERKAKENGDVDDKKHRHKRRHKDDGDLPHEECQKKRKLDSEHTERSNLTEEHGKPINSQNSSDSTSSNDQRQKPDFVPEAGQNSASIIRIRLPLQGQRDPEVFPIAERSCSPPVRTDFAREKNENAHRSSSVSGERLSSSSVHPARELAVKHGRTELHLSTGLNETSTSGNDWLTMPKLKHRRASSSELRYIDLIENWAPLQYQSLLVDLDDHNWLLEGKQKPCQDTDRCKVEQCSLVNTSSSAWPLSQLLPDLGIYALPYAVPY